MPTLAENRQKWDGTYHWNGGGVVESYLAELSRTLKPHGVAFVHHSNLAAHRDYFRIVRGVPGRRLLAVEPVGSGGQTVRNHAA